jgi:glycosyltransferase involved in cell wall biosynthesis
MLIEDGHWVFKRLSAWLLRMSDACMLLSTDEANKWRQFYPDGKYYIVCNPYSPSEDQPGMHLLARESKPEVPIILFVGRVITAKGIFELVDALAIVLKETRCRLVIAGDGEQMSELRAKIEQMNLREHVSLLGYQDRNSLKRIYSEASIFVLPTSWSEGFPTVIAEAMDAGLPIVTTSIRGAAGHLLPEVNALFIPPCDPASLATALLRLLKDPELRAKMGKANQEKVKDFSPEKAGKLYFEVLQDVLQSTPAPR